MDQTIYEAAGGWQAFLNLAQAWHARCLADPVVSHAFSHGYHPSHCERLAAYWAEALGGPADFSSGLGTESNVTRMHACNGDHSEMDERAEACFALALADAGFADDPKLRSTIIDYFHWALQRMSGYGPTLEDVPASLDLVRWSWNGPV